MESWIIVLITLGAIFLASSLVFLILIMRLFRVIYSTPKDNPERFIESLTTMNKDDLEKKRIVFAGDSLTQANLSASYIDIVKQVLGGDNYYYINAGKNAELSYNLLQRIDKIIACKPDIITILIGTNDVNREMGFPHSERFDEILNLPQEATSEWFKENLQKIIVGLKAETDAKIAICSIPILGEDESHSAFERTIQYSSIIKEIAQENDVTYLPINEEMVKVIANSDTKPKVDFSKWLVEIVAAKKLILQLSFDRISSKYNFQLLTDHIHLNTRGAKIIADKIVDFIQR